jgi:nicotinamide mononucleotide transporter
VTDPLEIAGVIFGVIAVWLTVKENIWCWPVGLVNVALFTVIFFRAKLYADMGLQVVYFVLLIYGWWKWTHPGEQRSELPVTRTPRGQFVALLTAGAIFGVVLGLTLKKATDASLPYADALTTSFSLVAQFLSTRKHVENWILWIAVDVVYVWMYVEKSLFLTAGLYFAFLVLAVIGLKDWRRSMKSSENAAA